MGLHTGRAEADTLEQTSQCRAAKAAANIANGFQRDAAAVDAELDVIKSRFSERMGGVLPKPVEMMLEKKHGCFDREHFDIHMKSGVNSPEEIIRQIKAIER